MKSVLIIGGGLAGLITAVQLAANDIQCTVIERKSYPFHRVCGEYISNETVPFLRSLGLYPEAFAPPIIDTLQLTSVNGKSASAPLDLGGFGISRFLFDEFLYKKALSAGATFHLNSEVDSLAFDNDTFKVRAGPRTFEADIVIGAFGKRSKLDIVMGRAFIRQRSPYLGVKYHVKYSHPQNLIALHNFKNGYCGVSNIEDGKTNLCYLVSSETLRQHKTIAAMESEVLYRNPFLKDIFTNAEFLFSRPETINEISFATKAPVEDHVLMAGDAAGMITPLCGNGMAMAIHSAKLLAELLIPYARGISTSRKQLEESWTLRWNSTFKNRLRTGRYLQNLFGSETASDVAVMLAGSLRPVARFLINKTHGTPF